MLLPPSSNVYMLILTSFIHEWLSALMLFLVFQKENCNNGYGPPIINNVVYIWVMFLGASALYYKWKERGRYKYTWGFLKFYSQNTEITKISTCFLSSTHHLDAGLAMVIHLHIGQLYCILLLEVHLESGSKRDGSVESKSKRDSSVCNSLPF